MLYSFFWAIPRLLNFICRHFEHSVCSIFTGGVSRRNNTKLYGGFDIAAEARNYFFIEKSVEYFCGPSGLPFFWYWDLSKRYRGRSVRLTMNWPVDVFRYYVFAAWTQKISGFTQDWHNSVYVLTAKWFVITQCHMPGFLNLHSQM